MCPLYDNLHITVSVTIGTQESSVTSSSRLISVGVWGVCYMPEGKSLVEIRG